MMHSPVKVARYRGRPSVSAPDPSTNNLGIVVINNSGRAPEWIQVVAWTSDAIQHHTKNGSITNPAESANPGLLAVGAAPWYDVNTIESFSSQGPAPDGRLKPEIVGADCGATALIPLKPNNRGFCGTSQAAPHVAGMAALVRQRFPEYSAQQVASYLKLRAEQRGEVPNNTWGYGFAKLLAQDAAEDAEPPMLPGSTDDCGDTISGDGAISGEWSSRCQSDVTGRGFAQYFTFTLSQQSQVTIDLESDPGHLPVPSQGRIDQRCRAERKQRCGPGDGHGLQNCGNPGGGRLHHRGHHQLSRPVRLLHPHRLRPGRSNLQPTPGLAVVPPTLVASPSAATAPPPASGRPVASPR